MHKAIILASIIITGCQLTNTEDEQGVAVSSSPIDESITSERPEITLEEERHLRCTGTSYANAQIDIEIEDTKTLSLSSSNAARVNTLTGEATGQLTAQPDSYEGYLTSRTGSKYRLKLDRTSGELYLLREVNNAIGWTIEFKGICEQLSTRF